MHAFGLMLMIGGNFLVALAALEGEGEHHHDAIWFKERLADADMIVMNSIFAAVALAGVTAHFVFDHFFFNKRILQVVMEIVVSGALVGLWEQ